MAKRRRWVAVLPMYSVSASLRDDWITLIGRTAQALGRGTSPVMLDPVDPDESPDALHASWRRDDVLLSQTYGYPLIRGLASRVQLIGTPRFAAPGRYQEAYSSAIAVRAEDGPTILAAYRGARMACNSPDLHSGMSALRHAVAPLVRGTRFFEAVVHAGSHLRSLAAVTDGEADVAAIDCVTLAFAAEHRPDLVAGLRQISSTRHVAGLPFIAVRRADDALVKRVGKVMCEALHDDAGLRSRLRLEDIVPTTMAHYRPIAVTARKARIHGYGELGRDFPNVSRPSRWKTVAHCAPASKSRTRTRNSR